jgi:hypothetical protein
MKTTSRFDELMLALECKPIVGYLVRFSYDGGAFSTSESYATPADPIEAAEAMRWASRTGGHVMAYLLGGFTVTRIDHKGGLQVWTWYPLYEGDERVGSITV